jgi:hypothetical protein
MPPELLDTVVEAARLALLFFTALFLPIVLQLGLLFAIGWLFGKLLRHVHWTIAMLLLAIGIPLHELFHVISRLITFCGVAAVKLIIDELGVAFVIRKRSNVVGNVVSSLAPLLGGVLVLWLTAIYIIPGFEAPAIEPPQLDLEGAADLGTVLRESVDYLGRFVQSAYEGLPDLQWDNWRTYMGFYIAFSIGIAMAPSSTDLKIFLTALPVAAFLIVGLFTLLNLDGNVEGQFTVWQQALWPLVFQFSTAVTYAFVLTSVGILVFLPLSLFSALRRAE